MGGSCWLLQVGHGPGVWPGALVVTWSSTTNHCASLPLLPTRVPASSQSRGRRVPGLHEHLVKLGHVPCPDGSCLGLGLEQEPWGTSLLSYGSSLSPFPAPLLGTWEPLRMGSLIAFPKPALMSTRFLLASSQPPRPGQLSSICIAPF